MTRLQRVGFEVRADRLHELRHRLAEVPVEGKVEHLLGEEVVDERPVLGAQAPVGRPALGGVAAQVQALGQRRRRLRLHRRARGDGQLVVRMGHVEVVDGVSSVEPRRNLPLPHRAIPFPGAGRPWIFERRRKAQRRKGAT